MDEKCNAENYNQLPLQPPTPLPKSRLPWLPSQIHRCIVRGGDGSLRRGLKDVPLALGGRHWRTGVGFDAVVLAEGLVKVQLLAVNADVHAAVVIRRHRGGG